MVQQNGAFAPRKFLLLAFIAHARANFNIKLLVTSEVRGAVIPVNSRGTQCSYSAWKDTPCECFGGAARLHTALAEARTQADVVAIDTGAHFFGSGLTFPTFRGNASINLTAAAGYGVLGLSYRDFTPGSSEFLAQYLTVLGQRKASLLPVVASNLNTTGDAHLTEALVKPYKVMSIGGGRRLALLNLLDPDYLIPINPFYASRVLDFDRALEAALASLWREGMPEVVVLSVGNIPEKYGMKELQNADSDMDKANTRALMKLVEQRTGINIVLYSGGEAIPAYTMKNWAGDDVLFVHIGRETKGTIVDEITATLGSKGVVQGTEPKHKELKLSCQADGGVAADVEVAAKLADYEKTVESVLQVTRGYLKTNLEGSKLFSSSEACLTVSDKKYCGCRVGQCGAGSLVADAYRWLTDTTVALVGGGSIRSSLTAGALTTAHTIQLLPFMNELVRVNDVPGSLLRQNLQNSISKLGLVTDAEASGRFAQVSGIKMSWYFEGNTPVLGEVTIQDGSQGTYQPLDDTKMYSVAMNSYMSGGGDGYNFSGKKVVGTGKADYEAVIDYVSSKAPTLPGLAVSTSARITQNPSVVFIDVGNMCQKNDERCHLAAHMASVINNKHDGFLDDLLPYAVIRLGAPHVVGCAGDCKDCAKTAFREIAKEMPNVTGIMGPHCSDEVAAVSEDSFRKTIGGTPKNAIFISGGSTAPSLRDPVKYPFLVRMQTPEHTRVLGFVAIMGTYGWKKVGMIFDSSVWSSQTQVAMKEIFLNNGETVILNPDATSISLLEFDAATPAGRLATATALLQDLVAVSARIVFIGTQLRVQRTVYRAMYQGDLLLGKGYGWMTGWTNADAFVTQDAAGEPTTDADAVRGGEGLIGMIGIVQNTKVRDQYLKLWAAASSKEACLPGAATTEWGMAGSKPYCDSDGDGTTLGAASSAYADAMWIFAQGMDKIYRDDPYDATALEQAIIGLPSFIGVQNKKFSADANGDRLGTLNVLNLQISQGDARRLRRRLSTIVEMRATSASYKPVGQWNIDDGLSFSESVIFPGAVTDVPSDVKLVEDPQILTTGLDIGMVLAIVCGVIVIGLFGMYIFWRRSRAQLNQLKVEMEKELLKFKDAMVGVRVATKNYLPGDSLLQVAQAVAADAVQEPLRSYWYWSEDTARLSAHNVHDVHQPGNFVKYAGSVCAELEEHYSKFLDASGPSKIPINLSDRIASTGTERKSYGQETGCDFEIDFEAMTQKNLKSGYSRPVLRIQERSQVQVDKEKADGKEIVASMANTSNYVLPADLDADKECLLLLHVGQIVQTSRQRQEDGWCYGSIIYDEVADRPTISAERISSTDGWFPLECTDVPNTKQLENLQARMGGVDALAEPSNWSMPMKDSLVAELFPVTETEAQAAKDAFMRTLDPKTVKVVKVERIQNLTLWQSFAVKRRTIMQRESDKEKAKRLERLWLFHGAPPDVVPKILQQGFNRSFCGRNATFYGKGVYFARDASYSSSTSYSQPDENGIQRMLLCRVVVGEYCKGIKDAIAPDVKSGLTLYDTTVDNVADPSIYVTYHDAQAYPEYIVHFKS